MKNPSDAITKMTDARRMVVRSALAGSPSLRNAIHLIAMNDPIDPRRPRISGVAISQILPASTSSAEAVKLVREVRSVVLIVAARARQPMRHVTYDSKMSAPIPATSPTLSPTLSAITPGFRGSSSGIPASTLPTRSEPTSAAFVYIPPPTRAKRATEDAPIAKPIIGS